MKRSLIHIWIPPHRNKGTSSLVPPPQFFFLLRSLHSTHAEVETHREVYTCLLYTSPGGVYHFHADAVGQRFKRNIERTHPGSSCILLPRCAAGTLIHIIIKFGGKYNARGAVFVPTAGNRRCIAARAQDFYIFLTLHGFYISAISDFTLFFYT